MFRTVGYFIPVRRLSSAPKNPCNKFVCWCDARKFVNYQNIRKNVFSNEESYVYKRMAFGGLAGIMLGSFVAPSLGRENWFDAIIGFTLVSSLTSAVGVCYFAFPIVTIPVTLMWIPSRIYHSIRGERRSKIQQCC